VTLHIQACLFMFAYLVAVIRVVLDITDNFLLDGGYVRYHSKVFRYITVVDIRRCKP